MNWPGRDYSVPDVLNNRLSLWFPGLAALACGDAAHSASAGVETGLGEAVVLSDLSLEQSQQACRAVERAFTTRLSPEVQGAGLCELLNTATAEDPSVCRMQTEACIESVSSGGNANIVGQFESVDEFDCEDNPPRFQGCTSTVGELEGCVEAALSAIEQSLTQFSCEDAATVQSADLAEVDTNSMPLPQGCAQFEAECALAP